ncbi:hypothetical protein [Bradyrhizobium sp. CCBAU 51765]|uniref:hypothetical protein n=1 Tax=Bradyrhizobium sp. CCBAU 51765 TaxID=1325102 RepID=UPI001886CDEE|nr:hypothetical protein [Bradyrhizobium sp. CCBAU 51765]
MASWLNDPGFQTIINEGVDDVDVKFFYPAKARQPAITIWETFQLKDTVLNLKTFNEILNNFQRKHRRFPATFAKYHVVTTDCVERLRGIQAILKKTKQLIVNYGPRSQIGKGAVHELTKKLKTLRIAVKANFLLSHVYLDFQASWCGGDNDHFDEVFHRSLIGIGVSAERTAEVGGRLLSLISSPPAGASISRAFALNILAEAKPGEPAGLPLSLRQPLVAKAQGVFDKGRPAYVGINVRPDVYCRISLFPGGSALIGFSNGTFGLIDCGRVSSSRIIPFLYERGIEALEFIAISHWHVDRYDGVLSIASTLKSVRQLWIPQYEYIPKAQRPRFFDQLDLLTAKHPKLLNVIPEQARTTLYRSSKRSARPTAVVEAFRANAGIPIERMRSGQAANDLGSVFRISVGARAFLLTADTTIALWRSLLKAFGGCRMFKSDGITVPRAGSKAYMNREILRDITETGGFYAVLNPDPRFRLPDAEVVELIRSEQGEILLCDDEPIHLMLTNDGLFEQRFPK